MLTAHNDNPLPQEERLQAALTAIGIMKMCWNITHGKQPDTLDARRAWKRLEKRCEKFNREFVF